MSVASYIEHTNLSPVLTIGDIDRIVAEASEFKFFGVCVPPFWVRRARREIGREKISLVTVAGFPLGYNLTETQHRDSFGCGLFHGFERSPPGEVTIEPGSLLLRDHRLAEVRDNQYPSVRCGMFDFLLLKLQVCYHHGWRSLPLRLTRLPSTMALRK